MNKRKENSLFSLISNSLFANIGKKINTDIVFILFNAGTSHFVLCLYRNTQNTFERKNNDIWICSSLFLLPVLFHKSSVKIVLRSFNPLFLFFVSSPCFSRNSLLCPKIIAIVFQKHCNCTPISPLLRTNCIEFIFQFLYSYEIFAVLPSKHSAPSSPCLHRFNALERV